MLLLIHRLFSLTKQNYETSLSRFNGYIRLKFFYVWCMNKRLKSLQSDRIYTKASCCPARLFRSVKKTLINKGTLLYSIDRWCSGGFCWTEFILRPSARCPSYEQCVRPWQDSVPNKYAPLAALLLPFQGQVTVGKVWQRVNLSDLIHLQSVTPYSVIRMSLCLS